MTYYTQHCIYYRGVFRTQLNSNDGDFFVKTNKKNKYGCSYLTVPAKCFIMYNNFLNLSTKTSEIYIFCAIQCGRDGLSS